MTFYLAPPKVTIDLVNFGKCYRLRLQYFMNKDADYKETELLETVIPGTRFDTVGHFVLRCFCLNRPAVTAFILAKETDLFLHRLNEFSVHEIRKACKNVIKDVPLLESYTEYSYLSNKQQKPYFGSMLLASLECVSRTLIKKHICEHFKTKCQQDCNKFKVEIPFQVCPMLVKSRTVKMCHGFAEIPCSQWKALLEELFVQHFNFGLSMISYTIMHLIHSDSRWLMAFKELYDIYESHHAKKAFASRRLLLAKNVDYEKQFFPPCMSHLLNVLRRNHRLTHIWRYYFSLFLKDIGLSVEESLAFWRHEYSKSCTAESSCTHSWQSNERKYRYSIRHLYGLEGGKREAKSKDCSRIQTMPLGMRDEGGCPFVHFDEENLQSALSSLTSADETLRTRIMELRNEGNACEACSLYVSTAAAPSTTNEVTRTSITFESPVDYYFGLRARVNESLSW